MHATINAIPPHEPNANEISSTATAAGNFSIIATIVSDIIGIGICTRRNRNLCATLPHTVIPIHTPTVTRYASASDAPCIKIETTNDVGSASGLGSMRNMRTNLRNTRDTVMIKKGVHFASARRSDPHLNFSPSGVSVT